ncbi:UNVERIFIED_CONTAM: hypothetical protein GTU68_052918, partial [Idotea baltica]|nr:hypothetical protein [Idotea baltica]
MLPKDLLKVAKAIQKKGGEQFKLKSFSASGLKKLGAGAILGVSRGSSSEPYLIHLHYSPGKKSKSTKRICFVGKGVTFDSGGLSMKSPAGMLDMKCDMAGAASVLGVMHSLSKLPVNKRPAIEVHALIPSVENMVGPDSIKLGDVVETIGGTTVEITNTDAEGRLILADALNYSSSIKADVTVDLATLTGACIAALGESYAGLFTEDERLAQECCSASDASVEKLWQLPIAESEYLKSLDSSVADIKNSAAKTPPGASIAAIFLKQFVPK